MKAGNCAAKQHLSRLFTKFCLINIGVLCFLTGNTQFYYTDIVLTGRNIEQMKIYKSAQVKRIQLMSYEADGQASDNFMGEVTPDAKYSKLVTSTRSGATDGSVLTAYYDANGKLYRSVDSSAENINIYTYSYAANGNLATAESVSATISGKDKQSESHVWSYDSNNRPQKMLWVKNGNDTTVVQFKQDEQGNITEEETFRGAVSTGIVYYYYDEENRLTDIVRYNNRLNKLMPDNIFEYNDQRQLFQMYSVQNGNDYLIWRYEYNNQDLKIRELCYNKQKKLVGRIEYQYEFGR